MINEKNRNKGWYNFLCGCFTNNNKDTFNVESDVKKHIKRSSTNERTNVIDSTIDIHPVIFFNGFINNSKDKIEYAKNTIQAIINEKVLNYFISIVTLIVYY